MLARNITIFRLPIDADHKNVFDFNDKTKATAQNYFFTLRQKFQHEYVTLKPTNRPDVSLNIEKEMDICVDVPCDSQSNVFISEFISTFNYLGMNLTPFPETDDNNKSSCFVFYFITGWKIMNSIKQAKVYPNSNDLSVTVLFNLKWDVWANNLVQIQNQTNKMFFERKHIDDFKIESDEYGKKYGAQMHHTDEEFSPKLMAKADSRKMSNRESYTVVFARVFFDREFKNINIENNNYKLFKVYQNALTEDTFEEMPLSSMLNMACAFIPLFVINTRTRYLVEKNVIINGVTALGATEDGFAVLKNFIKYMGSMFYYCDLTVQNFGYKLVNSDIVFNVDYYYTFATSNNSLIRLFTILPPPKRTPISRNTDIQYFTRNYLPSKSETNILKRIEFEPRMHYYPFEFFTIMCGQKTFDIKGVRGVKSCVIYEDSMGRMSPHFTVEYDSSIPPIYKTSSNFGVITTEKDSYIDFMRENKEKMNLRLISSMLPSSIPGRPRTLFNKVFSQSVDVGKTALQNMVEENSVFNSADSVSINNTFAMDDLQIQDDLIIFQNQILSEEEKEHIFNYFNLYGVNVDEIDSLEPTRQNFDFQKTIGCEPQFIRDEQDRREVAEIFNNGVRRWHLDTCYINALLECNTEFINLQNSLVESEV